MKRTPSIFLRIALLGVSASYTQEARAIWGVSDTVHVVTDSIATTQHQFEEKAWWIGEEAHNRFDESSWLGQAANMGTSIMQTAREIEQADAMIAERVGDVADFLAFVNSLAGTRHGSLGFASETIGELNRTMREVEQLKHWKIGLKWDGFFVVPQERAANHLDFDTFHDRIHDSIVNVDKTFDAIDEKELARENMIHRLTSRGAIIRAGGSASRATKQTAKATTLTAAINDDMLRLQEAQAKSLNAERAIKNRKEVIEQVERNHGEAMRLRDQQRDHLAKNHKMIRAFCYQFNTLREPDGAGFLVVDNLKANDPEANGFQRPDYVSPDSLRHYNGGFIPDFYNEGNGDYRSNAPQISGFGTGQYSR